MNLFRTTTLALVLLLTACQSNATDAPAEEAQALDEPAAEEAPHAHPAAEAGEADEVAHVHGEGVENVLAAGEYDESDVVAQPGASVGDIAICPVSGETFTVTADSPFFEHEGGTYYFCCPRCVRPFQRDPAGHLVDNTGMVEVNEEGVSLDPAVEKSQVPSGSWICDMGTVHYARSVEGDGICPRCNMRLVEHTN